MTSSEPPPPDGPDWSLFPSNLLITVAEKLSVADIIRLCTVCSSWAWTFGRPRNAWPTPPRYRTSFVPIPPSVPWMLLPNDSSEDADFCSFHDLSNGQVRRISPIPEMIGRRCVGASPDGWLVTLDIELNPRVLNPLTREELRLPSLSTLSTLFTYPVTVRIVRNDSDGSLISFFVPVGASSNQYSRAWFRDAHFLRIVLTSGPPFGVAAVLFGTTPTSPTSTQLAFSRIGDASWTPVPTSGDLCEELESIVDVMYHVENNRLYAMSSSACVMFFDLHIRDWPSGLWMSSAPLSTKPTIVLRNKYKYPTITTPSHLIFASGRLLQIWKEVAEFNKWEAERARQGLPLEVEDGDEIGQYDDNIVMTKTVTVETKRLDYMMTRINPSRIPTDASDLDDQAVFVGYNHVFSLPAAGRPGLKKNSIYFTETWRYDNVECRRHVRDAGVVDMETRAF